MKEFESQIGFSDEFSYGSEVIKYDVSQDGKLGLFIEDCARALGITDSKKLKDDSVSTTVRWNRVYEDLVGIERIANSGDFKKLDKEDKKIIRNEMKNGTITEKELYLWSFRVDSEQGKKFRDWLATTVLPNLREHGIYITGMENMNAEDIKLAVEERTKAYVLRKFGITVRRSLTDAIKKYINPRPEQSYLYGQYTNIIYQALFRKDCNECKEMLGLADKDSFRDALKENGNSKELNNIIDAEKFMCSLFEAGMTEIPMITMMLGNWGKNRQA